MSAVQLTINNGDSHAATFGRPADGPTQLRFDIEASPNLPEAVKRRLKSLGGRRVSRAGVLVLTASGARTQEANRRDAIARLVDLIRAATEVRKRRIPTRPGRGAVQRRLERKSQRAGVKRMRRPVVHPQE